MSSAATIGLVLGLVGLALVLLLILKDDAATPETEQIQDPVQLQIWDERAEKAREDFGLADTRAKAGKWAASAAAILGVLTSVAVVAGPNALKDIGGTEAQIAAGLVLAAAGVAAIATLLAALAEQGTPVFEEQLDGSRFRTLTRVRAKKAANQLFASRVLIVLALALIIASAGVAWLTALTGKEESSSQSAIVVAGSGAHCGVLKSVDGRLLLEVGKTTTPVASNARITLVDSCPK
jgi:hypothetical protein